MNAQPENFDRLKKLLALKRHEQPPPGYFENLSSRIIDRIEQEREIAQLPFWRRFTLSFDLKPAMVCATGVLVCGLLSAGVITSLQVSNTAVAAVPSQMIINGQPATEPGMPPTAPEEVQSSIEPVLSTVSSPSPFDQQISLRVQRVNYGFGN